MNKQENFIFIYHLLLRSESLKTTASQVNLEISTELYSWSPLHSHLNCIILHSFCYQIQSFIQHQMLKAFFICYGTTSIMQRITVYTTSTVLATGLKIPGMNY